MFPLFPVSTGQLSQSKLQGQEGPPQHSVGQVSCPSGKYLTTSLMAMVPYHGTGGIPRSVLQTENWTVASQTERAQCPSLDGSVAPQCDYASGLGMDPPLMLS